MLSSVIYLIKKWGDLDNLYNLDYNGLEMNKQVQLIKTDTDYAMRMLVYIALDGRSTPIPSATLVKTQRIPKDFAYKILQKLCRAKMLRSFKGPKGGFILVRGPQQITLLDVMEAVQGPLMIRACLLEDDVCHAQPSCPVSAQLRKLQRSLRESMQNITLAGIVKVKQSILSKSTEVSP